MMTSARRKIAKKAKRFAAQKRRSKGGSHVAENEPGSGLVAAAAYLEHWANRAAEPGWKFRKNRQSYLLRVWPEREKMPNELFAHFLEYTRTFHPNLRRRTIEQARGIAEDAGAEDGPEPPPTEEDAHREYAERRALRGLRRARGLKVLKALLAEEAAAGEEEAAAAPADADDDDDDDDEGDELS